jgi:hypothetical protein
MHTPSRPSCSDRHGVGVGVGGDGGGGGGAGVGGGVDGGAINVQHSF